MNEKIADKITVKNNQIFNIFARLNKTHRFNKLTSFINSHNSNKRGLRAEGFLLLPSALRPRLLSVFIKYKLMFPLSLLSSIILSSIIFQNLCSVNVSAASITLTIPSSFSLDINPGPNGIFSKSKEQTVNVKTDNSSGYTLSIKAKNSENGNSLINSNDSSNKLNSISESTTEDLFKNDSKFNNTWGYMPSKFNSEDNANFLPGPTTQEYILEVTEEANNETGIDYNIFVGAKIDSKMPSGNYKNDFVFSAIANEPKYDAIMQDWAVDYSSCGSLPSEQTISLLDKRDDNIYTVAKLKDGKCWMTQNLRLGDSKLTEKNPKRKLTSEDTDIVSDYILQESNATDFYKVGLYIPENYGENELAKYGAYYHYITATAGTGSDDYGGTASGSICPKGWRLPTDSSEFCSLIQAYGGTCSSNTQTDVYNALKEGTVPNFTLPGTYESSNLSGQDEAGDWFSSSTSMSMDLFVYADTLSIRSNGYINSSEFSGPFTSTGASVRCLTEPKKTMQTVDQWGSDVKDEEVIKAMDTRDGNTYTVSRLKDGKLWMTQNLRLINKTITSTDSDITNGSFTIPSSTTSGWNSYNSTNNLAYYGGNTEYGALYTWLTATAGTGTGSMSSDEEASSSICPKGWKLPTYDEMNKLAQTYSASRAQSAPANFGNSSWAGGCFENSCPHNQGSRGDWWSSTAWSRGGAYLLCSFGSSFSMTWGDNEGQGSSVRCIARY